jgi:hypothetical protein
MKKILFFALNILLVNLCVSQNPAYLKITNRFSLSKIEHVNAGGYISIGRENGQYPDIIRWNDQFDTLWTIKIADTNIISPFSKIVEANDGNFYYMNKSDEHSGCTYVMRIGSSGDIIWQKLYFLNAGSLVSDVLSKAKGTDNGFLIGGGECALYNYVIKCDQDGNIEWQYQYKHPSAVGVITCASIIPDGDNYIVSSNYNINTLLTFMLDSIGNVTKQSAYIYSAKQIVPMRIVKLNVTGHYAIVGNCNNSNNNKTEFVAIFDSNLTLLTFNELTVSYTGFYLSDIVAINNGDNVIVNGKVDDDLNSTAVMINISSNGNIVWKKRMHGVINNNNSNVLFDGITFNGTTIVNCGDGVYDGGIVGITDTLGNGLCNDMQFDLINYHRSLGKQTQSIVVYPANVMTDSSSSIYSRNITTFKNIYCGILTIDGNLNAAQENKVHLYPNPATNKIIIKSKEQALLEILNIEGQIINRFKVKDDEIEIDISDFSSGVYIIKATTDNGITTQKFIKE